MNKEELSEYIGNKIKLYRKKLNLTQEELANKVGTTKATISNWETGYRSPQQDALFTLADTLKISVNELFPPVGNIIPIKQTKTIPVLGAIACGEPILAEQNITDTIAFPTELLPSGNLFFLIAQGDSMEPIIKKGSYVMIRKQENVENGEIAAVLFADSNEATLKRVKYIGDNVMLEAENDAYDPIIVNKEDQPRIIGKAVKVLNEL